MLKDYNFVKIDFLQNQIVRRKMWSVKFIKGVSLTITNLYTLVQRLCSNARGVTGSSANNEMPKGIKCCHIIFVAIDVNTVVLNRRKRKRRKNGKRLS
jgi:hypothetical protein